jgi:transcription termination factor NusB
VITHRKARNDAETFDFSKLKSLRLRCSQIQQDQMASLRYFEWEEGFQHYKGKNKISVSSTATCILSLVATGNWTTDKSRSRVNTKALLQKLVGSKKSAGLEEDNPFTTAWILEAVDVLEQYSEALDAADRENVERKEQILQERIKKGNGGVNIAQYPASAYLTQLVVRVLIRRKKLTPELQEIVSNWSWAELTRQLALVQAKSKTQDAFAYLLMLVTAVTPTSLISPERSSIQRAALKTVFDCQLEDGTWPLSRPLFHYPNFGNAYCYEYEMLTQLLQEPELQELLLNYLPNLNLLVESLTSTVYRLEKGVRAWASGHHPQLESTGPESWTTASVYHFVHRLGRLLAEAIRRELFRYVDQPLPPTDAHEMKTRDQFAPSPEFLDSTINFAAKQRSSLRDFLWEKFVHPLSKEADDILDGGKFRKATPRSAILFGPPGTSKTELSKKVAEFLGWPLLAIDPSHLLRNGMDGIQAEANTIFRMLEETERVVVLFDEFDEFVKERGSSDAEQFSRLLTTAMLPKLASIHKRGTLVFIIATNNIRQFDIAIQRPGRFDHVMQIMPPTYEAKLAKKDWGDAENVDIDGKFQALGVTADDQIKQRLGDLTYGECDAFASDLAKAQNPLEAVKTLDNHWERCILHARISQDDEVTWAERCRTEAIHNR